VGGGKKEVSHMDNFDRYQYVWNNPVNYTDPTGERAWKYDDLFAGARKAGDWKNYTAENAIHSTRGISGAAHWFGNSVIKAAKEIATGDRYKIILIGAI
jgi:hypothetical protein